MAILHHIIVEPNGSETKQVNLNVGVYKYISSISALNDIQNSTLQSDESVHFVKVHAPWEVLTRYAEILKMKMKMKKVS